MTRFSFFKTVSKSRSAFTLIEMLVVVTIILMLMGLTAGAVSRAMRSAQRTKCMSNMRQIGTAILTYATENRGRLPPTRHSASADEAWITVLAPFLGNMDEIRISPADPRGAERLRRGGTSYLANDIIFDPLTDPFGNVLPGAILGLTDLTNPTQTMLAFIASDNRGTGATNDHTHARQWSNWVRFLSDVEADRFRQGGRSSDRTRGDANYLYADGGVQNLRASVMRDWINAGNNPGEPGQAPR
jgi:prepilin-type N-terminal cleavage/methylation domain-containing protein/prepilin-type processing-associated H-X9-DG protein